MLMVFILIVLQLTFAGLLIAGIYLLVGLPWSLIAGSLLCLSAYINLYLRMTSREQ